MNDLGHEARRILEAARGAESLPRESRARIKRGVLARVAVLGAASTVAGSAAAMSMATKVALVVVTVAAFGGGSMAVRTWKGRTEEPPATRAHEPPTKPKLVPEAPTAAAQTRAVRLHPGVIEARRIERGHRRGSHPTPALLGHGEKAIRG